MSLSGGSTNGIGLRYAYHAIPEGHEVAVAADWTLSFVRDCQAWWYHVLGAWRDEYLYTRTDARRITLAETPLTLQDANGRYLSFHEAAFIDFPSMLLSGNRAGMLSAWLIAAALGAVIVNLIAPSSVPPRSDKKYFGRASSFFQDRSPRTAHGVREAVTCS